MSSDGRYSAAAWRAHGAGTMIEAHVAMPVADRLVDADVGGVARAEVVAREDHQARVGRMTESFGERAHDAELTCVPRVSSTV